LLSIRIPSSVEVLYASCFSKCENLSSITFEYLSKLRRIECDLRDSLSLSVGDIRECCCPGCPNLSAIIFESGPSLAV
jgi:hypothetical protein